MPASPDADAFKNHYATGSAQVVWTKLLADMETPVSAFLKLTRGEPNAFLLESVEGGATRGRYSIIGFRPDLIFKCQEGKASINRRAAFDAESFDACGQPPLEALRALLSESRIDLPAELPPMAAGIFGYLGYDLVRQMEELPPPNPDAVGVPDGILIRPQVMMIFDNVRDEITLVTPVRFDKDVAAEHAYSRAQDMLNLALDRLEQSLPPADASPMATPIPEPVSNTSPQEFQNRVQKAQEYIKAGDIFQVVLGQRFEAPFTLPPFALYRSLRRVNPAPFLVYLDFGTFQITCSSPEILVRLRDGVVTIRPIAGTRPRGAAPADDDAFSRELLADPKERSEHLMLLDLGRNDVGRVAQTGTVTVTGQFFIERYSHVMHIVSNVEGKLDDRHYDAIDALSAGFPAGTVSGAPKVRAMEIIDELEHDKRGVYGGCIGYFGADGGMDTCIALRTAVIKDQTMYVQAGAGIVADSVPLSEHIECVNKARALFRAADEAVRFASAAGKGQ
jgi:anthranilate synthase component I